ncbi:hypothetical protein O6H91_Y212700 [Diphasiastrum complanatum]|nr:hypothetical protein O6H91_Y212700 [Diphasiastrum complanatum]
MKISQCWLGGIIAIHNLLLNTFVSHREENCLMDVFFLFADFLHMCLKKSMIYQQLATIGRDSLGMIIIQ